MFVGCGDESWGAERGGGSSRFLGAEDVGTSVVGGSVVGGSVVGGSAAVGHPDCIGTGCVLA